MEKLDVALLQMCSNDSIDSNVQQILQLLDQVPSETKWVFSPENSLYLSVRVPDSPDGIPAFAPDDPLLEPLTQHCQKNQRHLLLGSVPLKEPSGIYNASLLIEPSGTTKVLYKKTHLFDVEVKGEASLQESALYSAGDGPHAYTTPQGWRIGPSICFDLRFSHLYWQYALKGVDIITVPAAFLMRTGAAHWESLLRARAIESQSYVLAPAQCGVHHSKLHPGATRKSYGHSMLIDPWGEVLAHASEPKPCVLTGCLQKPLLKSIRKQIPMKRERTI